MRILDLTSDNGDIRYKISKFPDGQQSITILDVVNDDVKIKSKLNSFLDLEVIMCAVSALREIYLKLDIEKKIELFVPYFLGGRSDRKFNDGEMNYLKDVICPVVNSLNLHSVTVMDPHSDVLEACLNHYKKINNFELVKFALTDIDNTNQAREKLYLVSPDAGALKKVYDVAEHFDINKIIVANKHRDIKTGRVTHTEVPGLPETLSHNFVIVDDICDGGRTFLEIAKEIKRQRSDSEYNDKIYLIVTHGVFSAGFDTLKDYFDGIYSTNSISDIDNEYLKQLNIF